VQARNASDEAKQETPHQEEIMKEKAKEIGAKMKETVQTAQKQFQGFEEEVQKVVTRVQDSLLATPAEGIKKLDDLLRTLAVNDYVEKVRTIEMFKQGNAVKKDILDRFGLVAAEELDEVKAELTALKKKTNSLSRRLTGISKKGFETLAKRVEKLEG
jgi:hypothetical protein